MVALNGLIAVDVESLFKDQRAVTILEENNFRANVICIDSRKVTVGVIKDMSPAFFMPSGVVAGNLISDGAKKNGYTTATYSPFLYANGDCIMGADGQDSVVQQDRQGRGRVRINGQ